MKKRKPPIVLISIIILMLIGVAIMNSPNSGKKSDDIVQDARKTDSAADVASSQKKLVSEAELPKVAASRQSPLPEEGVKEKSGVPAIKVNKVSDIPKQTPSDNSQIGQWYSSESAVPAGPGKPSSPIH